MFDLKGEVLEIYSSTEKFVYKCYFDEEVLEHIEIRDSLTFEMKRQASQVLLRPATQYLQNVEDLELVLQQMNAEKELRVREFEKVGMLVEAERIKKRVEYDIRMIRETGFVNGIENYSLYFDKRLPGEVPNTIFDYFPDDFLLIIDESHMTIPQLRAMAQGDRARKNNLIKYGFRLPSAIDHRPLRFEELEVTLHWKSVEEIELDQVNVVAPLDKEITDVQQKIERARQQNQLANLHSKQKTQAKSIFLSATPAEFEIDLSEEVVEQIIRPTGLLDPITFVYPKS
jgi:excinuclease ABC subunit B